MLNCPGLHFSCFRVLFWGVAFHIIAQGGNCMPHTHGARFTVNSVRDTSVLHDGCVHAKSLGTHAPCTGQKVLHAALSGNLLNPRSPSLHQSGAPHPWGEFWVRSGPTPLHMYPFLFLHCLISLAFLQQALLRNWLHMPHTAMKDNYYLSCALSLLYPSCWAQAVACSLLIAILCSLILLLTPK